MVTVIAIDAIGVMIDVVLVVAVMLTMVSVLTSVVVGMVAVAPFLLLSWLYR